jgi:sugar-specific transcriptional regulator TrmB
LKQNQVKEFLTAFGLNGNEVILYLTLLRSGLSTIMDLSRETGIKRSTTHNTIDELMKKGLVIQTVFKGRRRVMAEDPDKLKMLLEKKSWEIQRLQTNLSEVINSIKMMPSNTADTTIIVKYYKGLQQIRHLYTKILNSTQIRSFLNLNEILSAMPDNPSLFKKALEKKQGMEMWEILEDSRPNRKMINNLHKRYNYKFLPEGRIFSNVDFMIFDDNVALVIVNKSSISGVLISNKIIYENLKILFDIMWESLPPA